jgi:hypothetical protein
MGCGAEACRGQDQLGEKWHSSFDGETIHLKPLADFFSILSGFGLAVIQMPVLPVEPGMAQFVSQNVSPSRHG